MHPRKQIENALDVLARRPRFVERGDQRQLAMLIGDCIESSKSGIFEAPTGLGKSLAALIPAIAHAMEGKRTIIATYTNVLAEQYLRQDLPLAQSLFEGELPEVQFLIGRQRYACLQEMSENIPQLLKKMSKEAVLGIESEFRQITDLKGRELLDAWRKSSAPPVCPTRLCPKYDSCFYYKARRAAENAAVVLTNHSVVLQDAILRKASEGEVSLLGKYDFLLIDEAHDLPQAAYSALEFELSETRLGILIGIVNKLEQAVLPISAEIGKTPSWLKLCEDFRQEIATRQEELKTLCTSIRVGGILAASPVEVWEHPVVRRGALPDTSRAESLVNDTTHCIEEFVSAIDKFLDKWKGEAGKELAQEAKEAISNYVLYLREFAWGCKSLFSPSGVSISHCLSNTDTAFLRNDVVEIAAPLRELLWKTTPSVCMSATLALDGDFGFFQQVTGASPDFAELLPSPFDYKSNAALFLPSAGEIPDPASARKDNTEQQYFDAIAREVSNLIRACKGKTLVLFHSRREMEEVYSRIDVPAELPIYKQSYSGAPTIGERFRNNTHASLFALRSFWTGFDAPGETLSCVILVRIPFEVPIDPPQLARQAWMQSQGYDPFLNYTLPMSKMLMRQGAGRLLRRSDDKGIIALLDPRLKTKAYGEEIIRNLPEMQAFTDVTEACAFVGIS